MPSTTRFNFLKVTLYTLSLGEMTRTCLSTVQTSKPQAHIVNCITAMSSPLGCPRLLDQEVQAQSELQHPLKHGTAEALYPGYLSSPIHYQVPMTLPKYLQSFLFFLSLPPLP